MNEPTDLTIKERGVREAVKECGQLALLNFKYAAFCRANKSPHLRDLAEHYEAIGQGWSKHMTVLMEENPKELSLETAE